MEQPHVQASRPSLQAIWCVKANFGTMKLIPALTICLLFQLSACRAQDKHIAPNDNAIAYMGRMEPPTQKMADLSWPGSSISLEFEGKSISARLNDQAGKNCYYFIVDSQLKHIRLDSGEHNYLVAEGLSAGKHKITLYKLTEGKFGHTHFLGFNINNEGTVLPASIPENQKKIEFYGNSITAGYSVDDTVEDRKNPDFFNNYFTYASITARHYNARYNVIAKSGIGLMLSWFRIIMPEMYNRVHEDDSLHQWKFSNFKPNVVVVDLLQNDSWLVEKPNHTEFKYRFDTKRPTDRAIIAAYKKFISNIRNNYPNATIICTLGSMDATKEGSKWPGIVKQAVTEINDPKILSFFFPYKDTPGHPKRKEQQVMADLLVRFIDANVKW